MAVLYTDRRGPVINVDASAAGHLAKALAAEKGKSFRVWRKLGEEWETGFNYLVTAEPDPGSGWSCVLKVDPPA